jgi:hypothetical protein
MDSRTCRFRSSNSKTNSIHLVTLSHTSTLKVQGPAALDPDRNSSGPNCPRQEGRQPILCEKQTNKSEKQTLDSQLYAKEGAQFHVLITHGGYNLAYARVVTSETQCNQAKQVIRARTFTTNGTLPCDIYILMDYVSGKSRLRRLTRFLRFTAKSDVARSRGCRCKKRLVTRVFTDMLQPVPHPPGT